MRILYAGLSVFSVAFVYVIGVRIYKNNIFTVHLKCKFDQDFVWKFDQKVNCTYGFLSIWMTVFFNF